MGNLCTRVNVLLLLLPSSNMGSEDEGQRTELTQEEQERRATIPLLRHLLSKQHHQQQQRSEADAWARRLRQEVDELDVYYMDFLHVESEALDFRMDSSQHLRMSSSPLLPKTALQVGPPPVRVLLEVRPRPVRDHLDSLIIPTTGVETLLGLMMNPVQSHLNSLVQVEAGAQLPPFCLVTQDLPPMSLERVRVVAGSAVPSSTERPSAQPGTNPLTILADGYEKGGYQKYRKESCSTTSSAETCRSASTARDSGCIGCL
jgi:hypothetical protein